MSSIRKKRGKKMMRKEDIRSSNKQIWSWKKASNCMRELEFLGAKVVDASWRSAQVSVLLVRGSFSPPVSPLAMLVMEHEPENCIDLGFWLSMVQLTWATP